jgi:hypothetical protein
MFDHTSRTVATYFPSGSSVYLAIPVLDQWDLTWEVGSFDMKNSQASRINSGTSLSGPLTEDSFKQQLNLDLAFNITQANPGPVSLPTPQASTTTSVSSSTSYVSRSKRCVLYANQTRVTWIWSLEHQRYYYYSIGADGQKRAVWQELPTQE